LLLKLSIGVFQPVKAAAPVKSDFQLWLERGPSRFRRLLQLHALIAHDFPQSEATVCG
jgi:hypothetical protein